MATNYANTTWVEGAAPGISAVQLNRIDAGVEAVYQEFDALVGALVMYAAATAPSPKWLIADGAEISTTTYADLFALIGHTYATNPGGGNFTLPDFRERLPIGLAPTTALNTLGETAGSWDHRHTQSNHQHAGGSHTHSVPASDSSGGSHTHTNTSTGSSGSHGHTLSGSVESSSHFIRFTSNASTDIFPTTSAGRTFEGGRTGTTGHNHALWSLDSTTTHAHNVGTLAVVTASGHTHTTSVTGSTTDSHSHATSANTGTGSATTANDGGGNNTGTGNPPVLVVNFLLRALP